MTSIRIYSSALCALILLIIPAAVFPKSLGVSGRVYPLAENDALEEIEKRAATVDWGKYADGIKWQERLKRYTPSNAVKLPPAAKDRVFLVDMTYSLPFDIPDGKGGILYPRGFTFNPLEYTLALPGIVVINGASKNEVQWLVSTGYLNKANIMLLISGGSWYDLSAKLKRNVFYLTAPVAERFRLEHTPSVVTKKNNKHMEVREFHVED